MNKIKSLVKNPDLGLLIFRIYLGLSMAIAHGWMKIPPMQQLVEGLASMGFPAPTFFAWCAALAEFGGGVLIALGLLTRLSAGALGFTMFVAGFVAHANDPFQVKELAFLFLASCVLLVFTGAGKYSLDKVFCKNK